MSSAKVKTGEVLAAVSAGLLFIVMFLGWYGIPIDDIFDLDTSEQRSIAEFVPDDIDADRISVDAWQAFSVIDLFLLLTIIVAVGTAVMSAASRSTNLPIAASAITTIFGGFATVLLLFRLISTPYGLDREAFAFVGLILAAGIAVGGWLAMEEEGAGGDDDAPRPSGSSSR